MPPEHPVIESLSEKRGSRTAAAVADYICKVVATPPGGRSGVSLVISMLYSILRAGRWYAEWMGNECSTPDAVSTSRGLVVNGKRTKAGASHEQVDAHVVEPNNQDAIVTHGYGF